MKRYELGLAKNYVADWDVWAAIREFLQNAIDQEATIENNKMEINYDENEQVLRITNQLSILEHHTLLLGNTSKADDENTIGMFGEGYKIAMLVLTRLGKTVTVYNYGKREIWNVHFSKLKKYDYVETLVVDVETKAVWSRVPDKNLTVEIAGITPEEYEAVKENTLLGKKYVSYDTEYGSIIPNEKFAGNIYINGLKVCHAPSFKYGYDMKPKHLKVGRDRNIIDSSTLYITTRKMWLLTERYEDIKELINSPYNDCENIEYEIEGWNKMPEMQEKTQALANSAYEDCQREYGDDVVVARSEAERRSILRKYDNANVVVMDSQMGSLLKQSYNYSVNFVNLKERDMTIQEKILEWGRENYISESNINKLFDIIQPMIEAYSRETGEDFYGNDENIA